MLHDQHNMFMKSDILCRYGSPDAILLVLLLVEVTTSLIVASDEPVMPAITGSITNSQ